MKRILGSAVSGGALAAVLLAGGCSDSDPLPSSYVTLQQQVSAVGASTASCILLEFTPNSVEPAVTIRPADGTCGIGTSNPGAPCGEPGDCGPAGECEPSFATCSPTSPTPGALCTVGDSSSLCPEPGDCVQHFACDGGDLPGAVCVSDFDCPPQPECDGALINDTLQDHALIILDDQVTGLQLLSPHCGFCNGNANAPCRVTGDCTQSFCQGTFCFGSPGIPCTQNSDCPAITCLPPSTPSIPPVQLAAGRFRVDTMRFSLGYVDFGVAGDPNDDVTVDCGYFGGSPDDAIPAYAEPQLFDLGQGRANVLNYVFDLGKLESVIAAPGDPCNDTVITGIKDILTIVGQ